LSIKNYLCCSMNPSKTANPTTGVIEAGPIQCLTRKTKHFWHHKLVQTNTLLDSQTTNTHPSPQPKKEPCSLGASVSLSPPHTRTNRTELAFVLVRPGRNPVPWTSFPAGQRDITLDQPNPATQIRTPQRPREPHHIRPRAIRRRAARPSSPAFCRRQTTSEPTFGAATIPGEPRQRILQPHRHTARIRFSRDSLPLCARTLAAPPRHK